MGFGDQDQLNCTASLDMHYYLDQPSREWSLPSETHQPGAFSAIYKASPKGGPAGEVQVTSTNNGMLAKISSEIVFLFFFYCYLFKLLSMIALKRDFKS